ncbi:unnamed protein product [Effrenium voratum]|uniref:Uncharacterized protein n=1 Tax=Effrenium voratum TaxID=2562239 RepID=A0AA36JF01_9DINO|nr:unnamed protein product [Effrenium voratum]
MGSGSAVDVKTVEKQGAADDWEALAHSVAEELLPEGSVLDFAEAPAHVRLRAATLADEADEEDLEDADDTSDADAALLAHALRVMQVSVALSEALPAMSHSDRLRVEEVDGSSRPSGMLCWHS